MTDDAVVGQPADTPADMPADMRADGNDPFTLWHRWLREATEAGLAEPTAAVVATVDADGAPDARYVLVRAVDADGFIFYTNMQSAKSRQLEHESRATLVFGWLPLQRSVRAYGRVTRVDEVRADAYFAQRPRGSQISVWASPQSEVLEHRAALERSVAAIDERFAGMPVPRPDFWSGWKVTVDAIEFWHGRPNRLHDRIRWQRAGATWTWARLAP